jgi:carbamoyltransferase
MEPEVITAGLGGIHRHGCAALADGTHLVGVCQQERVTRVRGAGFGASGIPEEALDLLLERLGRRRADVGRIVVAEAASRYAGRQGFEHIDHHLAHASTAYLSSPFTSAAVVVCDHEPPGVSIWRGVDGSVARVEWPWAGPGFTEVYSRCANAFGFAGDAGDQRFEALARLQPEARDERTRGLMSTDGSSLQIDPRLEATIESWCASEPPGSPRRASLAAAIQARLGELFVEFLDQVRTRTESARLCLAGSLFYHSSINTMARCAPGNDEVFVPVDPGNPGLAVGTALNAVGAPPSQVSPFLGPSYSSQEIKETLDNCKLHYEWHTDADAIEAAVQALKRHTLVAWFDGAMEWGPRALGARSILANPFAPYVLENLNRFLKHREPWRGYALSGLDESVAVHFEGPGRTPFMEGDYRPREPGRFAHVLPAPTAAIRVQTVGHEAPSRFRRLLAAFAEATGLPPILVNTSFNGFHEPIVCSPRDAVRVFYGSGLDLMVLDQFVVRK